MEKNVLLINKCLQGSLVKCGHKQKARKIYISVLEFLRTQTHDNPLLLIAFAVETLRPSVSLWARKVGGTTYKIPYLIPEKKSITIAIHALVKEASLRLEKTMILRLGNLILECARGRGYALKRKKEEIHKNALYNRAFLRKNKKRFHFNLRTYRNRKRFN